jgi:hypothetical protein
VDEKHVVPLFLDDMQRLAALEQAFRLLAAPEERKGVVPADADPGSVAGPAPFLHAERQPRQGCAEGRLPRRQLESIAPFAPQHPRVIPPVQQRFGLEEGVTGFHLAPQRLPDEAGE